jgi:hypothetical protein
MRAWFRKLVERFAKYMSTLLAALVAFLKEHQHCGDLDGAVEDDHVWLTCTSGAAIRREVDERPNERG